MERKRGEGRGERGGEGDPFSDRDRKSRERERRRGLIETEVGVVTERMSERVFVRVCVCVGDQVVLQWKQCEEDCSFWC